MKLLVWALAFFFLSLSAFAENKKCKIVETYNVKPLMDGKLTPFWAQEYIGADLAREEVEKDNSIQPIEVATTEYVSLLAVNPKALTPTLLHCQPQAAKGYAGTVDTECIPYKYNKEAIDFMPNHTLPHGNAVVSLAFGGEPTSATTLGLLSAANSTNYRDFSTEKMSNHIKLLPNLRPFSSSGPSAYEGFYEELIRRNIIIVLSAGNNYGFSDEGDSQHQPGKSFHIANLSPIGLIDYSSSWGPFVSIAAPSSELIQYFNQKEFKRFGGTSGAQPLAAGALVNVVAMLDGITYPELDQLVKKTALPTLNIQATKIIDGHGTINAYKLVEVAKKLRADWPNNRRTLFEDDSLYNFTKKATVFEQSGLTDWQSSDACKRTQGLKNLRRAFLLDAENKKIREKLAKIYSDMGYEANGLFYKSFSGFSEADLRRIFSGSPKFVKSDIIRYQGFHGHKNVEFLRFAANTNDKSTFAKILKELRQIRKPVPWLKDKLIPIVKNFKESNYELKKEAIPTYYALNFDRSVLYDVCQNVEEVQKSYTTLNYCFSVAFENQVRFGDLILLLLNNGSVHKDSSTTQSYYLRTAKYADNWNNEFSVLGKKFRNWLKANHQSVNWQPKNKAQLKKDFDLGQ